MSADRLYNAIVAGATGITGMAIVKALSADARFARIYACSRRPPPAAPDVTHVSTDFLSPAEEISGALSKAIPAGERIDYVFYSAYKEEETEQGNVESNVRMLNSFLDALSHSGIEDRGLKRIVLTAGAKYYGIHVGPIKSPMEEDDGRVEGEGRPPNFYYQQEDVLKERSASKKWDWTIAMPNLIIGYVRGNAMNIASSLAMYALITKELGEEFWYPGPEIAYLSFATQSHAPLIAAFEIWAALEPRASNQLFNIANGDIPSWQSTWPRLAARFGVHIPADMFTRTPPQDTHAAGPRIPMVNPPLGDRAAAMGLAGTPISTEWYLDMRIDLARWAARPAVQDAWKRIAARDGLDVNALGEATFFFVSAVLGQAYPIVSSMSKARRLGWTGYADTWDAYEETFEELERAKIIPKRH